MKYCFNYRKTSLALSMLDEINIKFHPSNLDIVLEYIEEHPTQRINARIRKEDDIYQYNLLDSFEDFHKKNPKLDFAVILPEYNSNLAELCRQKDLKFFFDMVVRDWETLHCFLKAGACDLYLVEQMMFEIQDAATAIHAAGARVRTFPNIVQQKYENTDELKSFFIRPEDVELYEGLVDVMEIFTIDEINQDIILEIYQQDKQWWGPLKEIIIGLQSDIDGKYIIPRFGERRLKCNRKCFKGQKCDVCDTIAQIGKNLQNVGLVIRYKKEDKTNGEGSREQSDSNEKIDGSI